MRGDGKALSFAACPLPYARQKTVQLGHGSGGSMMNDLIVGLFLEVLGDVGSPGLDDAAVLEMGRGRIAVSTDSFVVDPLFFPGGNIGELAVYGTVNDVCMSGAEPRYLSAGFILEEGFELEKLRRIVESMREAARRTGIRIVAGDTKVVNRGKGDGVFINTTGIGIIRHAYEISGSRVEPGDQIILSGNIAEHGIAVLSTREGLLFESAIKSDCAPVHELVALALEAGGGSVHALRDPTRGGLAATLNEFATSSRVGIAIHEEKIPVEAPVAGACELLGLDPLYVANEGKVVAAVAHEAAAAVLEAVRRHPLGQRAAVIGTATGSNSGRVTMKTRVGGWRIVDLPVGEQLPRIC